MHLYGERANERVGYLTLTVWDGVRRNPHGCFEGIFYGNREMKIRVKATIKDNWACVPQTFTRGSCIGRSSWLGYWVFSPLCGRAH